MAGQPGLAVVLLLAGFAGGGNAQDAVPGAAGRGVDFRSQVYPLLQQRCHACHGPQQQMGEYRLDSGTVALRGGVSGPNIVPGSPERSSLFQRITAVGDLNPMPLTGERLSPREADLFRRWIRQGADWPDDVGVQEADISRHWSYESPVRPRPPAVRGRAAVRNPVDNFVLARLERQQLDFTDEAPRETLVRRVSLDLRGLPPTVDEIDEFLSDGRPGAYARLVDRFLKSPHFGEHWAGYWLDLARYADTNGYESDEPRTMWAYRDWVVDAFNRNLPFDRFTTEQLAGDLLPSPTVEQLVATGFHRNTMLNNEAGSKNDEFYDAAVKDRVDTTATVWLGSTVGCAQCHDHKYDPFRQDEYYRLYALFNNTADSAIQLSEELEVFRGDPAELRRRRAEIGAARRDVETPTPALQRAQNAWERRVAAQAPSWDDAWTVLHPVAGESDSGRTLELMDDGTLLAGEHETDEGEVYDVTFRAPAGRLSGLRIEALPHASLPGSGPGLGEGGAFALSGVEAETWAGTDPSSSGPAWSSWHAIGPFRVRSRDEAFRTAFPPESNLDLAATYEEGHLAWNERKDWVDGRVHYLSYVADGTEPHCASYAYRTVTVSQPTTVTLSLGSLKGLKVWLNSDLVLSTDPTRDIAPDQEEIDLELPPGTSSILLKLTNDQGPYGFYFRPYSGEERFARMRLASATGDHGGWEAMDLAGLLDGRSRTGWVLEGGDGDSRVSALLRLESPVHLPPGATLRLRLTHDHRGDGPRRPLGHFRVSATSAGAETVQAMQDTPGRIRELLSIPAAERSSETGERLAAHYRSVSPELAPARRRLSRLQSELETWTSQNTTSTLVMRELPEGRETHVQRRGNFLDRANPVEPGVPLVLDPGGSATVANRLDLAGWLVADSNPLTARVRVNQIWNRLFGRGLVKTMEDFGTQGSPPSHPGLLDWLATEFRRVQWDTQRLLRTIMLSATYRQSSVASAAALEADPTNELLSRGARYRMPAESVRDIALAASGQLTRAVGGPSVFPPQPPEVFGEHFIEGGFKHWPTSEGPDRYRRGLYTFYKRTIGYPTFMNFDAPDRTVCMVDRSLSNTPLQALNTLNDPVFFEAAGALADTMLSRSARGSGERLTHGFRAALGRFPKAGERKRLEALLEQMAASYQRQPGEAAALVTAAFGDRQGPSHPETQTAAWVMVASVLLNLDGTFTRE